MSQKGTLFETYNNLPSSILNAPKLKPKKANIIPTPFSLNENDSDNKYDLNINICISQMTKKLNLNK